MPNKEQIWAVFFLVARLMHNSDSEQWSLQTKTRWPHQGALYAKTDEKEKIIFCLPFFINHTHNCISIGHDGPLQAHSSDFSSQFELNRNGDGSLLFLFVFRSVILKNVTNSLLRSFFFPVTLHSLCVCWFYGHNLSNWTLKMSSRNLSNQQTKEKHPRFWCWGNKQSTLRTWRLHMLNHTNTSTDEIRANETKEISVAAGYLSNG